MLGIAAISATAAAGADPVTGDDPDTLPSPRPETAILSVEAFTVDGGFILLPTEVPVAQVTYQDRPVGGSITVFDILNDFVGSGRVVYTEGSRGSITRVAMPSRDNSYMTVNSEIVNYIYPDFPAQAAERAVLGNARARSVDWLEAGDFTRSDSSLAGSKWVIILNNVMLDPAQPANDPYRVTVKDGDVVRIAFTVTGNGADLAVPVPGVNPDDLVFPPANRDELYEFMADRDMSERLAGDGFEPYYDVRGTASAAAATQAEINRAVRLMAVNFLEEESDFYHYYDEIEGSDFVSVNDSRSDNLYQDFYPENPTSDFSEIEVGPAINDLPPPQPPQIPEPKHEIDRSPRPSEPTGVTPFVALPILGGLALVSVLASRRRR